MYEVLNLCQLHQVINEPARITSNHESLTDILATNSPEKLLKILVYYTQGSVIIALCTVASKLLFPNKSQNLFKAEVSKHYNNVQFKRDLLFALDQCNWHSWDPNHQWDTFECIFILISEMHAPIKSRRVKSEYVPWLTPTLIQEMNHRDYLKKKAVLSKSNTHFTAYKTQRNSENYLVKHAKIEFCQKL